jgi:UDP-GlcNAc3NAcA epimerase
LKKIIAVIGARPQFIKHFPLELAARGKIDLKTIHTGQHYDAEMSQVFFDELGMRKPDYLLEIGSGLHGFQTGKMMIELEKIVLNENPDGVIVYGDTNSTLAGALVASKLNIPLIHIEAGLRSYNKTMPEEINRILTDHVSNLLFAPSEIAVSNLYKEGVIHNVYNVGDIMKDLVAATVENKWLKNVEINEPFIYATIHRPYNTDKKQRLSILLEAFNKIGKRILFPIHPRTKNLMKEFGLKPDDYQNIEFLLPQSYFNNLSYLYQSYAIITDSGGMQKEAYWMKKKCITVRTETEWTETLKDGWNTLLFDNLLNLKDLINGHQPSQYVSLYGEGIAAKNIIEIVCNQFL